MTVTIGTTHYEMYFQYSTDERNRRVVKCIIAKKPEINSKRSEYVTVTEGETTCSATDVFVKETGRKIALEKALADAGFPRCSRALFWKAYHNRRA